MRPVPEADAEHVSMLLTGLSARSQIIDLPLGVFRVKVTKYSGAGECAVICMVNASTTDSAEKCTVVNDKLCFGCMACVAQRQDKGVTVEPSEARPHRPLKVFFADNLCRVSPRTWPKRAPPDSGVLGSWGRMTYSL